MFIFECVRHNLYFWFSGRSPVDASASASCVPRKVAHRWNQCVLDSACGSRGISRTLEPLCVLLCCMRHTAWQQYAEESSKNLHRVSFSNLPKLGSFSDDIRASKLGNFELLILAPEYRFGVQRFYILFLVKVWLLFISTEQHLSRVSINTITRCITLYLFDKV